MNSMTGYGRGECLQDGFKITVELSSVNRKQAEIAVVLPRGLELLEAQVRDGVNRSVARGRVTVRVSLHAPRGRNCAHLYLNRELAGEYARELSALARQLKLLDGVSLDHLVRAPGVFQTDEEIAGGEDFRPAVDAALHTALTAMLKMRAREGAHLAKDLARRVALMRNAVGKIKKHAPKVAERYRSALLERIKSAGIDSITVDDDRLLKEVVLFADRSDISEELTRLESHFQQFDALTASKEPVGRTLDFLSQEINREINTIGSKANDTHISREVVMLKSELEKFREQAMNVE